jgi:beta-phosphoglucomutase-like phosphatase (HAD superfamily)
MTTAEPDPFTVAIPTAQLEADFPAEAREATHRATAARNPGYDVDKLHHMLPWDVARFDRPQLPALVGVLADRAAFSAPRGLRVLDQAIRMPGRGWAIPRAFAQFEEVIRLAVTFERSINPDFDALYYAYLTIDQKRVEPGRAQRRVGWHGDAFVSPETSALDDVHPPVITDNTYVVFDALSTLFLPGPFSLRGVDPTDIVQVLARFDELAQGREPLRYPPYHLLRMTPYDVHTPDVNATGAAIDRTFVKIQFSRDRLNMMGNGLSRVFGDDGRPRLSYEGWTWVPRNPDRRNNRNSLLDWDRPDRDAFRLVQPGEVDFTAATPGVPWTAPRFFWARKVEGVRAAPALPDERLETVGAHGSFRSTFNIAQAGDWKITTSQGDQYFLGDAQFRRRYREGGEPGLYLPVGAPQRMAEVLEPIRYRSPWGAWAFAPAGSVLARAGEGDVYAILPENFRASFVRTDEQGDLVIAGGTALRAARAARPGALLPVRDEEIRWRVPHVAVFDLHGTLALPNWKAAMARVYARLVDGAAPGAAAAWVERSTYGASDALVMARVAALKAGVTVEEALRLFQEERAHVGRHLPLQPMPGAPGFLAALRAAGIPLAVATFAHTPRARTLEQLQQVGALEHLADEAVICGDRIPEARDRDQFRDAALRLLQREHPGAQLLFFNDTADGMETTRALGGIAFGVPQGEGEDWEHRSVPLIAGGAHYLVQDWTVATAELLALIRRAGSS